MHIEVIEFYHEEFRRKVDQEKYQAKGTCEVNLKFSGVALSVKNITYRIDHEGKIFIKPPYRIHSYKKKGQKPKLVPSITFEDPEIWTKVEELIKSKILKSVDVHEKRDNQLNLWNDDGCF